jgi:hypothetical protein
MHTTVKKLAAGTVAVGLTSAGLVFGTAAAASATDGSGQVYVQNYSDSCEATDRVTQFVLDALGADTATTYTISDGTPPQVVTVAPHSTARSALFSIPASGAAYSITASTGQSWSFTAAADCKPVLVDPVVVAPPVDPAPVDPAPAPADPAPADPAPSTDPVDPAPTDPADPVDEGTGPVVTDPETETPDEGTDGPTTPAPGEKVTATVAWLMPEGTKPGTVAYDQLLVSISEGDQLDEVSKAIIAEACAGEYQVDVYHGYIEDIDAVLADETLTKGEDSALYVKHRLVSGTEDCTVPPVDEPTTPEEPTVPETPVDEVPVTTPVIVPVTIAPVVDATPVTFEAKPAAKHVSAASSTDGLAYTGSADVTGWIATGLALALAGVAGVVLPRVRARHRA